MSHIAFTSLIFCTIILYALLEHFRKRWLAVPLSCLLGGTIAFAMGAHLLSTEPDLPNMNLCIGGRRYRLDARPATIEHFAGGITVCDSGHVMWSPDFLGHQYSKISCQNVPKKYT
ncbi:DUF3360 family protein [Vibrio lentus]|nr:DUF3360 family protein [Vibrio lentus]